MSGPAPVRFHHRLIGEQLKDTKLFRYLGDTSRSVVPRSDPSGASG